MRILIADDEVSRVLNSQMLARLAGYGNVKIVQNGRDAVLAYVNTASRGLFYDLIVLDQHLTVLDGFATVEMIRAYESEHRKFGKRTMVCVISSDGLCQQQCEIRYGKDERTNFPHKPVNLDFLDSLASSVAVELTMANHNNLAPMRMRYAPGMQA